MVKSENLKFKLIPKGRTIYFDEEAHRYSDNFGYVYTSATTLIGKYHRKFDDDKEAIAAACEKIGKNPSHPKYKLYKNKTAKQLLYEWAEETIKACDKGTKKHNYFETSVKSSNGYNLRINGAIDGSIYTIDNIIAGHRYGKLSLDFFRKTNIDIYYPDIFNLIKGLTTAGFKIYSEIGVYDTRYMISGLIDILLVRGHEFLILDWKTNKAPIRFESGYYEKLPGGYLNLNKFVYTDKFMFYPISNLADSIGNHYTLQLSIYDYLVESFGFTNIGNILCHVRTIEDPTRPEEDWDEEVKLYDIKYLKSDVEALFKHHIKKEFKGTLF